jgi:hypothetical protein
LPRILAKRQPPGGGRLFAGIMLGLWLACGLFLAVSSSRIMALKTAAVGTGGDRFFADATHDARVAPTLEALDMLRRTLRGNETLVAIPEGTTLNYLLRRRTGTPYLMYNPWEFAAAGGEEHVLESLRSHPPDYVTFFQDLAGNDPEAFGSPQYGQFFIEWLRRDYETIDVKSSADPSGRPLFQATILRRRSAR